MYVTQSFRGSVNGSVRCAVNIQGGCKHGERVNGSVRCTVTVNG